MVLIETDSCDDDLSTYDKKHLYALLRFAVSQWEEIEDSKKYRSVILFKNHGVHSGGSIRHAHMQIVGLDDVDYREHVIEKDFEGYVIDKQPGVEFNLSKHPRAAFTEFNVVLSDMAALDLMADYIQVAVHFILNHMNKRFQSYNIFFYRLAGKVMAKIVLRAPGSPYLMGYSIVQIPNNLNEVVEHIQSIYFTNK
jgi:ATP adenylyltransferase/5',5'''-P-1,P-4-tetraphosphate phosphorylase II